MSQRKHDKLPKAKNRSEKRADARQAHMKEQSKAEGKHVKTKPNFAAVLEIKALAQKVEATQGDFCIVDDKKDAKVSGKEPKGDVASAPTTLSGVTNWMVVFGGKESDVRQIREMPQKIRSQMIAMKFGEPRVVNGLGGYAHDWTIPFQIWTVLSSDGSGNIPVSWQFSRLATVSNWAVWTTLFDYMRVKRMTVRYNSLDFPSLRVVAGATPTASYGSTEIGITWDADAVAAPTVAAMILYDHRQMHYIRPGDRTKVVHSPHFPLIERPGAATVDFSGDVWMDVASFNTTPNSYTGAFVSNAMQSGKFTNTTTYFDVGQMFDIEFRNIIG